MLAKSKHIIKFNVVFRLITMVFVLIMMTNQVVAQNLGESLVKKDITKVEALIEQDKLEEAALLIERVISTTKNMELYHELAVAYYLKGDVKFDKHNWKEAYSAYYESYSISKLFNDIPVEFESLYRMGELYYTIGSDYTIVTPYIKALEYLEQCEMLNYGNRTHKYQILLNDRLANSYYRVHNYNKSEFYFLELYKFSRQQANLDKELESLHGISNSFMQLAEYGSAIEWELRLANVYIKIGKRAEAAQCYLRIADYYKRNNQSSKAVEFYNLVLNSKDHTADMEMVAEFSLAKINVNAIHPDYSSAKSQLAKAMNHATALNDLSYQIRVLNLYSLISLKEEKIKEAIDYNSQAVEILPVEKFYDYKLMVYHSAVEIYKRANDYKSVAKFQSLIIAVHKMQNVEKQQIAMHEQKAMDRIERIEGVISESTFAEHMYEFDQKRMQEKDKAHLQEKKALSMERERKIMMKEHEKQMLARELENKELENEVERNKTIALKAKSEAQQDSINALKYEKELLNEQQLNNVLEQQRKNMIRFILIGFGVLILLIVFFFSIRKANKKLKEKNIAIAREHQLTEEALIKLRETQSQLIESERLASLGQLTAGIAHEIRNPLNFVNNFSKLNLELLDELKEELSTHIKDAEVLEDLMELAEMINGNSEKVSEHGERASRIIKQMLDSSRKGGAEFAKTDIPVLLEESTKLAYQGFRGKYVDYMAELDFDFDNNIKEEQVVGHDLGRVIINLVSNSCHATFERQQQEKNYKPKIKISTKDKGDAFEIIVEDNGKGMKEEVRTKVFDPFFTTKSTGEGTGLGLTMTFDIITKVHKGSIVVESKEGDYTRFIMTIPKKIA
jgi:signal transduction histidine kinase